MCLCYMYAGKEVTSFWGGGWNQYTCIYIYIYYVNNSAGNSLLSVKYCNNGNVYIYFCSYTGQLTTISMSTASI